MPKAVLERNGNLDPQETQRLIITEELGELNGVCRKVMVVRGQTNKCQGRRGNKKHGDFGPR